MDAAVTVFVHSFLAVVRRMVKFDSFTGGAARFLSGITGAVFAFCLSSGLSGEAGGSIWRSFLADGICSWWMEAAFTTGTEARSATVPP